MVVGEDEDAAILASRITSERIVIPGVGASVGCHPWGGCFPWLSSLGWVLPLVVIPGVGASLGCHPWGGCFHHSLYMYMIDIYI